MTTKVSISSVLQRAGKSVETVLSVVDIADDAVSIATNYMARVKSEQIKASKIKEAEFDNNLKIEQAQSELSFKAQSYQLGVKARQLSSLPEYDENIEAFNNLLK